MLELASSLMFIGLLITSAFLWQRLILSQNGQTPHPLSPRSGELVPLGFVDVVAAILIIGATLTLATTLSAQFTGIRNFDLENVQHLTLINIFFGGAQLLAAGLTLLYLYNRYGKLNAAGLDPGTLNQDMKLGFYGFLLFVPPMLLLQAVLTNFWQYEHPTMDMISPESPLISIVSAWWMATIVAPVSEEIMFRVVLLGWLLRCFANPSDFIGGLIGGERNTQEVAAKKVPIADHFDKPNASEVNPFVGPASAGYAEKEYQHQRTWPPVLIVALLFAVVHIGQGPAPIPIFFLGLGLCFMYRQTLSVVPCIVTHFLLNTFSMAVFTLQQLILPEEGGVPEPVGIADFAFKSVFHFL